MGSCPYGRLAATPPANSICYWGTRLRASLNANEALLSKNRKGGGTSSIDISLLFNGLASYQRSHHKWCGEANLLYTGQYSQNAEGSYRKLNDHLYLDTPSTATT